MFHRLLLAIDETPAGEVGVSFATALAKQHGASVHVFHANEFLVGGRGVTAETHEEAARVVHNAVDQLRGAGVEVSGECRLANCLTLAPRIADAAARSSSDAILMGSNRHRRFTRLFGRGIRGARDPDHTTPGLDRPGPAQVGSA